MHVISHELARHILSYQVVILWVESDVVFVDVLIQTLRPKHLSNLDQLVVVIVPVKERLLAEDLERTGRSMISRMVGNQTRD